MPTAGGCRYPQQQKHALRDVTQDVKRGRAGQRRWPAPFRQPRGGAVILRCCCGTPAGKPGNPGPGGARNMVPIRKPGVLSRSWRACRPPGRFPSSERGHRSCRRAPSCRRFRRRGWSPAVAARVRGDAVFLAAGARRPVVCRAALPVRPERRPFHRRHGASASTGSGGSAHAVSAAVKSANPSCARFTNRHPALSRKCFRSIGAGVPPGARRPDKNTL